MKIRIKFSKHGAIRYIGHLDVMRYFQKAMRRADIDIKYTEGMSPHQVMSFAQPLSVGSESDGEYLDIEVNHTDSSEISVAKLNKVMADGIRVLEYKQLPDDAKNAMSCITAADYEVDIRQEYKPDFDLRAALTKCMLNSELMITKKTKKGEQEFDIRPYLYDVQIESTEQQCLSMGNQDCCMRLFMRLSAGSENNIKPKYVMEALYRTEGRELPEYAIHITRKELYMNQEDQLIPLGNAGDEIC
ncbi:MAG: TIGR03936 family radical SAM-associated protein [bacterium]|nr:TIGR03936 family radical SAM-associated protein [bacterium]